MIANTPVAGKTCGTVGGIVIGHDQNRTTLRRRTPRRRLGSPRQKRIRLSFAGLAMQWGIGLTAVQRAAWKVFAANMNELSRGCSPRLKNGYQWFIALNIPRVNLREVDHSSFLRILIAPTIAERPAAITSITRHCVSGDTIQIWGDSADLLPAGTRTILYASRAYPDAVEFVGNPWHLAASGTRPSEGSTWEISANQTDSAVWFAAHALTIGSRSRIKLRHMLPDGRISRAVRVILTLTTCGT